MRATEKKGIGASAHRYEHWIRASFLVGVLVWVIPETPVVIRGIASLVARERRSERDHGSLVAVVLALTVGANLGAQLSVHAPAARSPGKGRSCSSWAWP